ncbi:glutathione S-transferase [Dactylonectria macrodidyma]|uniref:Glutathione S-transferase n=1 Tax=Dactylonectria macrodidyma TaxID=307937 RepID=A0A9P9IK23_9HYPO|nr:glutathione S-transferase [Dactylonectria macrodidyma]
MLLYDNIHAPNPLVVRIFIFERGGLELDIQAVDILNLENRRLPYRTNVNSRGEIPALRLDDGTIITEITAICGYLDEIAEGGNSLFGTTPTERAVTRMWLRRMDIEIAQPLINWYRNGEDTIDFYRGNRTPAPQARVIQKVQINQALNMLDDELEGKVYLCGSRFSAADILLYGIVKPMLAMAPWVNVPGRLNVAAWFKRMDDRDGCQKGLAGFKEHVSTL